MHLLPIKFYIRFYIFPNSETLITMKKVSVWKIAISREISRAVSRTWKMVISHQSPIYYNFYRPEINIKMRFQNTNIFFTALALSLSLLLWLIINPQIVQYFFIPSLAKQKAECGERKIGKKWNKNLWLSTTPRIPHDERWRRTSSDMPKTEQKIPSKNNSSFHYFISVINENKYTNNKTFWSLLFMTVFHKQQKRNGKSFWPSGATTA